MNRLKIQLMRALAVSVLLTAAKGLTPQIASAQQPAQNTHKIAIVVLREPVDSGFPIAQKALSYALQLKKAGVDVSLIFDGRGVQFMAVFLPLAGETGDAKLKSESVKLAFSSFSPEMKANLANSYKAVKDAGIPVHVSPGSAKFLGWKKELLSHKVMMAKSNAAEELDIAAYVLDGFQVWIF
ncbi:MAG: hypothetical protein ABIG11_10725 [bacterium]